jgi:virginiamycin B lyase
MQMFGKSTFNITSTAAIITFTIIMAFGHPTNSTATQRQATEQAVSTAEPERSRIVEYPVPQGSGPHDVAPASDGKVWYTAQRSGELGWLDPESGDTHHISLGQNSAPHGVIIGPDGAPWVTDGGLNAIVRVDPKTQKVDVFPLPSNYPNANLNTAVFDKRGVLWFTGQRGVYGYFNPKTQKMEVYDAPDGRGPYGITVTPSGDVYYASLAGNHIARIDVETGKATKIEPPTQNQGARRIWSDLDGRLWVSEWNAGQVAVYDPKTGEWQEWKLPGERSAAYAVYVDENNIVWLSDFANNAIIRFEPESKTFMSFPLPSPNGAVRQIAGRPAEVWGAESGVDKLIVISPTTE